LSFENGFWYGIAGNLLGTLNMLLKAVVGVTVMIWVRWTLPRLRIDQVITTCLKYCVPIAAIGFAGAAWWQYVWPHGAIPIWRSAAAYEVHEMWPLPPDEAGETESKLALDSEIDRLAAKAERGTDGR
jgi:NADH-quinone oxidoreductase subunit H